jgi:hypothetical protein
MIDAVIGVKINKILASGLKIFDVRAMAIEKRKTARSGSGE